ncbi:MAG TPA: hypothetical protein VGT41_04030 [Candidatus Babeliales bacterium]|nr:hypothetical protein [Candidatus Babeliales bacterium]
MNKIVKNILVSMVLITVPLQFSVTQCEEEQINNVQDVEMTVATQAAEQPLSAEDAAHIARTLRMLDELEGIREAVTPCVESIVKTLEVLDKAKKEESKGFFERYFSFLRR